MFFNNLYRSPEMTLIFTVVVYPVGFEEGERGEIAGGIIKLDRAMLLLSIDSMVEQMYSICATKSCCDLFISSLQNKRRNTNNK